MNKPEDLYKSKLGYQFFSMAVSKDFETPSEPINPVSNFADNEKNLTKEESTNRLKKKLKKANIVEVHEEPEGGISLKEEPEMF